MKRTTKQLKSRTRTGRLNFSVTTQGNFLGARTTANTVAEVIEKSPKHWAIIEFRNDDGNRVCVTREFMDEDNMSVEEVVQDWLKYADQGELEEPIRAMGPVFGVTLEW